MRSAAVVCYLDFDGVLHHHAVYRRRGRGVYISPSVAPGRTLFEWAGELVTALQPYPQVRIVLSTSWVRVLGYSHARARLPASLVERVIGATYHSRVHGRAYDSQAMFLAMGRWEQIWEDVGRRRPTQWFAIDDDVHDWPDRLAPHLVACDGNLGLSSARTREALAQILAQLCG